MGRCAMKERMYTTFCTRRSLSLHENCKASCSVFFFDKTRTTVQWRRKTNNFSMIHKFHNYNRTFLFQIFLLTLETFASPPRVVMMRLAKTDAIKTL